MSELVGSSIELDESLNPCYSGIASLSIYLSLNSAFQNCLNPCYSGIASLSRWLCADFQGDRIVLILVIVELLL